LTTGCDNAALFCEFLTKRQIPFMFYTGYPDLERRYRRTIIVQKPASGEVLLVTMAGLIASDPLARSGCNRPLAA
jgi:hypothetical protein